MHSKTDIEAFTDALNKDIEGDTTATSQNSDLDSGNATSWEFLFIYFFFEFNFPILGLEVIESMYIYQL